MKHLIVTGLLGVMIFTGTSSAQAAANSRSMGGFLFDESFIPVYTTKTDTSSFTDSPGAANENGSGFDTRTTLGYVLGMNIFVGVTYNYYTFNSKRGYVTGGDSGLDETTTRSEYGPTVGYVNNGWRALFTYFLSGTRKVQTKNSDDTGTTGDITITNSKMSGYQFSFGYTFSLGANVEIGPSLIYRNVSYSSQAKTSLFNAAETYSELDLFSKNVEASLSPVLSLQVRF